MICPARQFAWWTAVAALPEFAGPETAVDRGGEIELAGPKINPLSSK